jgi:hypothetical protein
VDVPNGIGGKGELRENKFSVKGKLIDHLTI